MSTEFKPTIANASLLRITGEEHLPVRKAVPIFLVPRYFCACSDTYHFCRRLLISALSLSFEAFGLSLLAFVSQVAVTIRFLLKIHR